MICLCTFQEEDRLARQAAEEEEEKYAEMERQVSNMLSHAHGIKQSTKPYRSKSQGQMLINKALVALCHGFNMGKWYLLIYLGMEYIY